MSESFPNDRKMQRYAELLKVGRIITSEMNFEALFPLVIQQTNSIMDTEASSAFLFDEKTNELWSLVSTDLKRSEIRILATQGVAGWVFQQRTYSVVNDASNDPRFNASVDAKTGFHTRNILCVPLINRQKKCIGTLQTLNKQDGVFTEEDVEVLASLSDYVTVAVENSRLYEELKAMNKAKDRAISHLSHELKTPLALVSAVLGGLGQKIVKGNTTGLGASLSLAERNVARLLRLQQEIDNIMNEHAAEYQVKISRLIEDASHFVEHQMHGTYGDALKPVLEFIVSIYKTDPESIEAFPAITLLHGVCEAGRTAMGSREVWIVEDLPGEVGIATNRSALERVFEGILRNAIESTPDEGRVEVTAGVSNGHLVIHFRDFGTGITEENEKLIFTGFFHTQDTDHYSTKTPYAFNAGGAGADLLRAKVFSERYGFLVEFESTRCAHLPDDTDECPGRISRCLFAKNESPCQASGTVFTVKIPMHE